MAKKKVATKKNTFLTNIFRRSLFYSVCLFALLQFMLVLLQVRSYSSYWMLLVMGGFVVVLELLYSRLNEYMRPFSKQVKHWRKRIWNESFLHHLLLPGLFYISGSLFLYFNRVRALSQVAVLLVTVGFLILFYNISCTYRKMYSISKNTRYVFDFINIIVFYFFSDILINSVFYRGLSEWVIYLGTGVVSLALVTMMIVMFNQFSYKLLGIAGICSIIISLLSFLVMQAPVLNIATLSLLIAVAFYLVDVYWHHKLEGTYDSDTMSQYVIFAIMVVILLLYI
ncbi:MAG: hypothetical protein ABIC57_00095 [bacterium]